MGVRLLVGEADQSQCVGGDGGCGSAEQAPEGVRAVPGQFHLVGYLAEGGLDPVAPFGDDLEQGGGRAGTLLLVRRDEDCGAAGALGGGEALAVEAFVREQVTRWRPGLQRGRAVSDTTDTYRTEPPEEIQAEEAPTCSRTLLPTSIALTTRLPKTKPDSSLPLPLRARTGASTEFALDGVGR